MKKLGIFNLCQALSTAIASQSFLENSKKITTAFTRKRKMPFCDIMYFIISSAKRSVQAELDEYFRKKDEKTVSRQAFAKSRENIKHEAFIQLNDLLVDKFERESDDISTFRGYRLFGTDGTMIDLPNTDLMRERFGFSSNGTDQCYAKGLGVTAFDVLNKMTIFAELFRYDDSEKRRILHIIDDFAKLNYPKSIYLLDRGYPSFELFSRFEQNHQNYVVRVQSNFLKEVNNASAPDQTVSVKRKGVTLNLRVVNILFDNRIVEKLVTNLPHDFTIEDLKILYAKRWGIETNYRFLKKKLFVEIFTGETVTAVLQDFHAAILVLNIAAIAQREQDDILRKEQDGKTNVREYHPNLSKLIADIKRDFVHLMMCKNPLHTVFVQFCLYANIKRYAYSAKPHRSFKRNLFHKGSRKGAHSKFVL